MAEFSAENLIVVYRQNDTDSIAFAREYQRIYALEDEQLLAIPCSNKELLSDYATFLAEIETPIKNALQTLPLSERQVFGFLVMPFVPGGFIYNNYKVSTTSRIANLNKSISIKTRNNLFDRQIYKRYDENNTVDAYLCTRIDGPLLVIARWLQNIENAKQRTLVTGKFYLDAYSDYNFTDAAKYTNDLEYFRDSYLSRLGLSIEKTKKQESVADPFFPILLDDSFFWGWGINRGSSSFFRRSEHLRSFFYNADLDGASEIRITASRTWPMLAIRANYAATAACIAAVDATEFLQPKPFMDSLFRGSTLAEAYLFAQPLLDASLCCFGDPLMKVAFPNEFIVDTRNTISSAYIKIEDDYAKAVMSNYRRSKKIDLLRNLVAAGKDVEVQLDLLYPMNDLYRKFGDDNYKNDFNLLTNDFFNYIRSVNRKSYDKLFLSVDDFLTYTKNKISDIILETSFDPNIKENIAADNILPLGYWDFIETIEHYSGDYRFYNFDLQIAKSLEDFDNDNILEEVSTFNSNENWYYETSDGSFTPLLTNGIGSNFVQRKIKYISKATEYLNRGEYYIFRFRQVDENQAFDWRYKQILIYH